MRQIANIGGARRLKSGFVILNTSGASTMETELQPDFREFLKLLNIHRVEYLVIGGYAVVYHGYMRMTDDLDVWVRRSPDNANRIVAALKEFGFDVPKLSTDLFTEERKVTRMGIEPQRLEILTSIPGVDFDTCWAERAEVEWNGISVNFLSLKRLRENKRAAGRHKDLADLDNLPE